MEQKEDQGHCRDLDRERSRRYYEKHKDAHRIRCRNRYRIKKGLPVGSYAIVPIDADGSLLMDRAIIKK